MRNLTDFQIKCENTLIDILAVHNKKFTDRQLGGKNTTYISGKISNTDLYIYIYEDEAEFGDDQKLDCRFERPDFDTTDGLLTAFIRELSFTLKNLA